MNKLVSNLVKLATVAAIAVNIVGCSIEADYVENADRNDVITLGDSIFDLNGVVQETLESYAGQTFRDYTTSGAEISGGSLAPAVDVQYAAAKATDPNINTVVMNGGGNDILIPAMLFDPYGCRTHWWRWNISSSCVSLIEDTYVNAVNLLNQIDTDGAQNVVYMGYYETPRGNSNLTKAVQTGVAYLSYACDTATNANCTYVDTLGTVPASQVESDDIHPTPEGSVNLANQVWPVLQPLL